MSYDTKCYELAETFLKDAGCQHDGTIAKLAQEIQDTIEDFLADLERETQP